jgi:putative flippase GtrA
MIHFRGQSRSRGAMGSALQFILFCFVGAATTLIDFAIFNFLTRPTAAGRRMAIIPANILSVSAAMTWSFLANWLLVFHPGGHDWLPRAGRFLATTAFSAFVLQNVVLYLMTRRWLRPVQLSLALARRMGLAGRFSEDAISRNTAKGFAVTAGLIWNFFWYKFFVYSS